MVFSRGDGVKVLNGFNDWPLACSKHWLFEIRAEEQVIQTESRTSGNNKAYRIPIPTHHRDPNETDKRTEFSPPFLGSK